MKTNGKKTATLGMLGLLLSALALAGCNDHIDIKDQTNPPISARVSTEAVEIKTGIAVGFKVVAKHGNDEIGEDRSVELHSDNPLVIGVSPTVRKREFVIYGVGKGSANISVQFDGEEVQSIPVTVMDQ